mgnify:CR=1 FL=1
MQVEALDKKNKKYFEKLYTSAFPLEERIDIQTLYRLNREGLIEILILKNNDTNLGLAVIYLNEAIHLLSYFAIDTRYRGLGLGSRALYLLKESYDDLIIEIESTQIKSADDFALRNRRKAFYIKNGYKVLDDRINYFGIEMELMATRDAGLDEYFDTYLNIFDQDFIKKNIKSID